MGPEELAPEEVEYRPPVRSAGLPFEVIERSSIIGRKSERQLAMRQRSGFHQLILCTSGRGTHIVDFEAVSCQAGTLIRIHPGQVQQFEPSPEFEAHMVVWPHESHQIDTTSPSWYPGGGAPTTWQLDAALRRRVGVWIDELHEAQVDFSNTETHRALLQSMLTTLLLRLELTLPVADPLPTSLPEPYMAYRQVIEEKLYERPSVAELGASIGYSPRTLDRACQQVTGQTARQVLDSRLALELRRLLTHTSRPTGRIAESFGFTDRSNFAKFVKRHTGMTPAAHRRPG